MKNKELFLTNSNLFIIIDKVNIERKNGKMLCDENKTNIKKGI